MSTGPDGEPAAAPATRASSRPGALAEDVSARLIAAWRGEIEARRVYELIAARERDPGRAELLRKLAQAEAGHRERLEARMRQLAIEIPDARSVRISPWLRLQARVAPIPRLLAAREAAETDEVAGVYGQPTGDPETDAVLREIRADESAHSMAVRDMLASPRPGGSTVADSGMPAHNAAAASAQSLARERLDRIIGRERWHKGGGGWVAGAIYGANDGLAAVFGIVAGVSGATGGKSIVLTAGLAGAIASALSMATGAFLAERSESEVAAANLAAERREIAEHPEEEREELSLFYQLKGLDKGSADVLAQRLAEQPEAMLSVLAAEELGTTRAEGRPAQAALAGGLSTALGAIVPVIPFIFVTGDTAIIAAAIVSLAAHFVVGAAKSLVTLRSWWASGFEMTVAGVIVGGALYGIGLALPVGAGG
jgi:VIT1/CCC1 family predicted Fe2+/Mn2+ transporter/rubrerythrin